MPSKRMAPALDRLVRREWRHADEWPDETMAVVYKRKQLVRLIRRGAAECARIAKSCPTGIGAESAIYEQFGIEEGKDG